ncbi:fatty acyl-CoA hydrolase precursor, medium chain-like [Tiliqua scincoides]|uniref:fatty acyl-CoA hydrolase precursor, medium chain-like n=1 Tax=Tiliqua scincoides TaxID=71010 RepID=UPI003462FFB1
MARSSVVRHLLLLILVSWALPLAAEDQAPTPPEVLTKNGRLRGQRIRASGAERDVDVFLKVPYAKPPVGPLRFSPPQPAEPWNDLRDATSFPPMCLQDRVLGQAELEAVLMTKEKIPMEVSEDCLYLNIYTPAHSDKKAKLPVMVWIHGGGLLVGAASQFDGSELAAFEDVVVVVIQYRLGILGFYSTGDAHSPGNWGFLDQVAALQWVQENIADFRGDPGSVTVFGESAGGFCTSALVLSPLSKGLFHKAISESGVVLMEAFIDDHPEKLAKKIAETAGCQTSSSAEMVRCLKEKTEEEIFDTNHKMDFTTMHLSSDEEHTVFFPAVVDGVFLPKAPKELLKGKKISNVPHIIGVNNHESGWIIPSFLKIPKFANGLERETVISVIRSSEQFTGMSPKDAWIIADEYLKDFTDPLQLRNQLFDMWGDVLFVAPAIQTARYHRDASYPVYVYEFQHGPSSYASFRPDYVRADHGDEIGFVFGKPFLVNSPEEEKKLSRTVMKYWANFARNGNPNGDGLVTWPKYDRNEEYLEIGLKQKVSQKLREEQVVFWTKTLPEKLAESQRKHTEL